MQTLRFELAWQPIFGGGLRGIDYWSVLQLTVKEATDLLDLVTDRRGKEVKAAFKRKGP